MGLVWGVVLCGLLYFLCFSPPIFSFFSSSPSLFCFCWKKGCDQNLWLVVLCWGLCAWMVNTKPEKWSKNRCWDCLHFGRNKKGIEKLSCNDFISLGLKAWVILMDKPQHFWDVLAHAILGLFWVNFYPLIFFLLWLSLWLLTWQCLDHLQKCALCEFHFLFVSVQSREIHGLFPSLSPFPSHLPWFPFVCFESQRHKSTWPGFQLLC